MYREDTFIDCLKSFNLQTQRDKKLMSLCWILSPLLWFIIIYHIFLYSTFILLHRKTLNFDGAGPLVRFRVFTQLKRYFKSYFISVSILDDNDTNNNKEMTGEDINVNKYVLGW